MACIGESESEVSFAHFKEVSRTVGTKATLCHLHLSNPQTSKDGAWGIILMGKVSWGGSTVLGAQVCHVCSETCRC